jgi:uncharacterized membrane protein
MRKTSTEDSSLLADFFSNSSPEAKREVFREVLHKASASQREVVAHAAKIRCSHYPLVNLSGIKRLKPSFE